MKKNVTKNLEKGFFTKKRLLTVLILCSVFNWYATAQETVLANWDFAGKGGTASVEGSNLLSGISSATASFGAGLNATNYLSNGLTASNHNSATLADAIANDDYIKFTVSPVSGNSISVGSLDLIPVSQNRERTFALMSSVNGFNSSSVLASFNAHANSNGPLQEISLTGHENITGGIEFRLYVYGVGYNVYEAIGLGNATGIDLEVSGSVSQETSDLRNPDNPTDTESGIEYSYYEGNWDLLPDFGTLTPVKTGNSSNFDLSVRDQNDYFGFEFSGYIEVPADGDYTFYTSSDDGSKLYIGEEEIVDNDGLHGVQESSGSIGLKAGKHAIRVVFFEKTGEESLSVSWEGPGLSKAAVPSNALYRATDAMETGSIVRKYWLGISGTSVADIPLETAPSGSDVLTSLEGPVDWDDQYGTRIRGYIVPSTSGAYTFYVSGDDNSELWLSSNSDPAGKAKIAEVTSWTSSRQWDKEAGQQSQSVQLESNTPYYVEVLHKEGGGGDNIAVGWTGPGISQITIIPGSNLAPFEDDGSTPPPADTEAPSVPEGLAASNVSTTSLTLSWAASSDNVGVTEYEVFVNGNSAGTTPSTSMEITGLNCNTSYALSVKAMDAADNISAASSELSVTTGNCSTTGSDITIDKSTQYQTIDGFGFFGAQDVWWAGQQTLYSDAWADLVISDLGITIWRNEYYPPADQYTGQDADWNKQLPVVRGLRDKAAQYDVDLKFVFTVWSPPSAMKCAIDEDLNRLPGTPHPDGTKWGGALDPTKYSNFSNWLKDGIQLYKNEGIDIYAISPQNEPYFYQPFNSCFYAQAWYPEMINAVIPAVKSAYPDVKIFGSENMLEMEAADHNWPWFYHKRLLDDPTAGNNVDILAVHGYSDGVAPSSGTNLAAYWTNHRQIFGEPMNKKQWMTETSGYVDEWESALNSNGEQRPGAINLAMDIHAALYYGNVGGWIWWQGSESPNSTSGISDYALMNGTQVGKKYYASKHFYRYIRPDAVRVKSTSADDAVFVTAYEHAGMGTHTVVIINSDTSAKTVNVNGSGLPSSFTIFRSSATENCQSAGTYNTGSDLVLPARSLVTLQAGGTALKSASTDPDVLPEMEKPDNSKNLVVYPNPASDYLYVTIPQEYEGSAGKVKVYNQSGQIMVEEKIDNLIGSEQYEFDISNLSAGVYLIELSSGDNSHVQRFMKK